MKVSVDPHGREARPWRQLSCGGTKEDRTLRQVTVWSPPAIHDVQANATSMVASTLALHDLIRSVDEGKRVALSSILTAHKTLMADDPAEMVCAGRVRDMQNWIGGFDFSPRGALYIPTPPESVDASLADLIAFVNRTDLSVLAQAAVAHAQFESIQPFTDGNGRALDGRSSTPF